MMQERPRDLGSGDRRIIRKWRITVVGFYGSLLLILGVLSLVPGNDVQTARADPAPAVLRGE